MTAAPPNPWGSCFDAAAWNLARNDDLYNPQVCHGIGIANKPGEEGTPIAHAWIEFDLPEHGRVALDPIWLVAQHAERYRKSFRAEYVVTYSRAEFLRLWAEHDFPGPWDKRVWALTTEGKSAMAESLSA
jgi:transglutaminase-like putative cysteine protease